MNSKQITFRNPTGRLPARLGAILSVGLLFLAGVATLGAQSGPRDLDTVVEEILENQGVSRIENVNPDQVDQGLLEELGQAVMDQDTWRQDASRVAESNRWIGYRYLRSGGDPSRFGWGPGMMGPGMMGYGRSEAWNNGGWAGPDRGPWGASRRPPGMMGSWGGYRQSGFWLPAWAWVLLAVLLVAIAVLLIVLFTRRGENKNRGGSAIEIVRDRYARGEITREEFQRIKEEIR